MVDGQAKALAQQSDLGLLLTQGVFWNSSHYTYNMGEKYLTVRKVALHFCIYREFFWGTIGPYKADTTIFAQAIFGKV